MSLFSNFVISLLLNSHSPDFVSYNFWSSHSCFYRNDWRCTSSEKIAIVPEYTIYIFIFVFLFAGDQTLWGTMPCIILQREWANDFTLLGRFMGSNMLCQLSIHGKYSQLARTKRQLISKNNSPKTPPNEFSQIIFQFQALLRFLNTDGNALFRIDSWQIL